MKRLDVVVLVPENAVEKEALAKVIRGCMAAGDPLFEDVVHRSNGRFATVGEPSTRFFVVVEDARGRQTVHEDHGA